MRIYPVSLLLATALLVPPALAQTAINETRPLDARGRVDISNIKGRIEVRGWEHNEVQVTGTLGKGVERLEIDGSRDQLDIKVRYPRSSGWGGNKTGPTELVVMVPVRADLDIESVAADVHVNGVAPGELSINSVSGNVVAAAAPRKADVETVSGNATLTLNSEDVDVSTVSGSIVLRGRLNGDIDAETVSGRIEVLEFRQALCVSQTHIDGIRLHGVRVGQTFARGFELRAGHKRQAMTQQVCNAIRTQRMRLFKGFTGLARTASLETRVAQVELMRSVSRLQTRQLRECSQGLRRLALQRQAESE